MQSRKPSPFRGQNADGFAGPNTTRSRNTTRLMIITAAIIIGIATLLFTLDAFHFGDDIVGLGDRFRRGDTHSDDGAAYALREKQNHDEHLDVEKNNDDSRQLNRRKEKQAVAEDDENGNTFADSDQRNVVAEVSSNNLVNIEGFPQTSTDHYGPVPARGTGVYHNPYPAFNRSKSRPCSGLSYTQGRWVKREELKPRYDAYGEILGCCQRGYDEEHGKGAQRPETKYVWESDECDLHEWDEEMFCRALQGRNLMIAGDSLNDHWHASLFYLLGGKKDIYRKEGTTRGKRACATHPICGKYYPKPLKLYFLTNQLLEEERRLNRNYKWWKHIHQYPILILNAGSWMRDPQDETREVSDDEYFRHMEKALRIVKRQNFTGTLIWRTTYQGHPFCWNYDKPLTEELQGSDFPRVAPYLRYRWWAIPHRNNYTVNMWRNAGAHILDVRRITNLMPLGHLGRYHPKYKERNVTDCLHYCAPGPVYDTWSMLLQNLLAGNIDGV